jgi:uncharacterized RDD family membrane protein YckC
MNISIENAAAPGLWRRLAAIFYDSWLVAALWLLGATADTFVRAGIGLGTEAFHLPLQIYLLLAPPAFFCWFWTHGGQTLGMRAWRLKLFDSSGNPASLQQSIIRFGAAILSALPLGLGYLWVLFDRNSLAWHDHLSGTRLVLLRKD